MLDWDDLRFFLAVAREGSLARAARALAVNQTTVSRRLGALEAKLGVALFIRSASGFRLTGIGARTAATAEAMEEAARTVAALAAGESQVCEGAVRIATTESLAQAFVIPAAARVQAVHPQVRVTVLTGWPPVDLRRGEADLAVRLVRPTDPRLACRKLAAFAFGLYASRSYLARRDAPRSLTGHALVAYEDALRTGQRRPFLGLPFDAGQIVFQTNSGSALLAATRAGLGIGEHPQYVGDAEPDLVRLFANKEEAYTVWLVVPQALRRVPAVRVVCDAIAAAFDRGRGAPRDRAGGG